jgi:hypothetical protein
METIAAFLLGLPLLIGVGIIILTAIVMAVLIETEKTGWVATITTALIVFVVYSFKDPILDFITSNTLLFIGYILGYIAIGVVWSIIKWYVYVSDKMKLFKQVRQDYINMYGDIDKDWKKYTEYLSINRSKFMFNEYVTDIYKSDTKQSIVDKILPQASEHKALITSWISHWVISFVATFLNNPLRRLFEYLFERLSGVFNSISVSVGQKYVE